MIDSPPKPLHGIARARITARPGLHRLEFRNQCLAGITPEDEDAPVTEGWIDAAGGLVVPAFVDAHFHLDSVHSLDETGENKSGTLLEGIALWKAYKSSLTPERIYDRAVRYCRDAALYGLQAIRSHVDVSYDSLAGVEALLALKKDIAGWMDIQLVAFPQDGLFRNPNGEKLLLKALDAGVEVVGGIPHFERTYDEGTRSLARICDIASERGLRVDVHCDETDDAASRHVETLARLTVERGLEGRTSASHTTSLHSADNAWFAKLLPLLSEAGLAVIPNPLVNLTLQGRFDTYPKRRGITRVPELVAGGVRVALGQDCVRDPWYPLGTGNLLDVAHLTAHACHLIGADQRDGLLPLISSQPASVLGLSGHELRHGEPANILLFKEQSFTELLRLRPKPVKILRRGGPLSSKK